MVKYIYKRNSPIPMSIKQTIKNGKIVKSAVPLDIKKFEQARVPKEKLELMIKDKKNLGEEYVNLIRITDQAFRENLEV